MNLPKLASTTPPTSPSPREGAAKKSSAPPSSERSDQKTFQGLLQKELANAVKANVVGLSQEPRIGRESLDLQGLLADSAVRDGELSSEEIALGLVEVLPRMVALATPVERKSLPLMMKEFPSTHGRGQAVEDSPSSIRPGTRSAGSGLAQGPPLQGVALQGFSLQPLGMPPAAAPLESTSAPRAADLARHVQIQMATHSRGGVAHLEVGLGAQGRIHMELTLQDHTASVLVRTTNPLIGRELQQELHLLARALEELGLEAEAHVETQTDDPRDSGRQDTQNWQSPSSTGEEDADPTPDESLRPTHHQGLLNIVT